MSKVVQKQMQRKKVIEDEKVEPEIVMANRESKLKGGNEVEASVWGVQIMKP